MRLASEELPAKERALVQMRKEVADMTTRRGDVLECFNHLLETQSSCAQALQHTGRQIDAVRDRFVEERGRRRAVREAVRHLAGALNTLDEQLEALDMQECRAEEVA